MAVLPDAQPNLSLTALQALTAATLAWSEAVKVLQGQAVSGISLSPLPPARGINLGDLLHEFLQAKDRSGRSPRYLRGGATAGELEADLASGWIIFDPHAMFPGRLEDAFRFFCEWVYEASARGPGVKVLVVDEVWKYCSPLNIPAELALCIQTGRNARPGHPVMHPKAKPAQ